MKARPLIPRDVICNWDEIRHRKPPKGLSKEQYWLSLKLGRRLQSLSPALLDKQNHPFVFSNPDMVLRQLHEVDKRGPGDLIFDNVSENRRQSRFRMLIRPHVEEAIQSSLLEGASTTREKAKKLLDSGRDPETHVERMIWNNLQANEFVQHVKDDKLTPAHIRELHRIVTDNTLDDPGFAGRWRLSDNVYVADSSNPDKAIYVPPPALTLPERIERICAFANRDLASKPFIHPVIHAILLHFMIGYDHPFVGRKWANRPQFVFLGHGPCWLLAHRISRHLTHHPPGTRTIHARLPIHRV